MQFYETDSGKLFYCIYTLHKRQLISLDLKSKLKDLLIMQDDGMLILLNNISQYNEQQVLEQLLTIVHQQQESNQDFEYLDNNNSIKSTHTLRPTKPHKIILEKKCKSTRSQKRISTLKISP